MASSTARQGAAATEAIGMPEPVMAALQAVMGHLVESLLHDVRNPLNALAINLEVLNEKLKDESGTVLKSSEKNIRAMREQVFRVDTVLRMFAEFLAPRPGGSPEHALSHLVERALEVLSHEARKGGVKLRSHLQPNVMVWCSDGAALRFLTLQSILRALLRAGAGAEVCVDLERKEGRAVLTVSDPAGDRPDPYPQIRPALEALAGAHGVEAAFSAGQCRLAFPLA